MELGQSITTKQLKHRATSGTEINLPESTVQRAFRLDHKLKTRLEDKGVGIENGVRLRDFYKSGQDGRTLRIRLGEFWGMAKDRYQSQLLKDLGTLIFRSPSQIESDTRFRLSAFYPIPTGDFAFSADLELPRANPDAVIPFVQESMTWAADALMIYGKHNGDEVRHMIEVDYDQERGVELRLSAHSSVHTLGENYKTGQSRVELSGNNVRQSDEPLVYLIGSIALAHADDYI